MGHMDNPSICESSRRRNVESQPPLHSMLIISLVPRVFARHGRGTPPPRDSMLPTARVECSVVWTWHRAVNRRGLSSRPKLLRARCPAGPRSSRSPLSAGFSLLSILREGGGFRPRRFAGAVGVAGYGIPDNMRYARLAPLDRNRTRLPQPRTVWDARIPLGRPVDDLRIMGWRGGSIQRPT